MKHFTLPRAIHGLRAVRAEATPVDMVGQLSEAFNQFKAK